MENWRKIPGYPSRFEVSDKGRVRTIDYEYMHKLRGGGMEMRHRKGRVLAPCVNTAKGGYVQVTMTYSDLGVRKVWSGKVHRLVALAFVPNPSGLPEVNHLDSDKTNNCASNLEWVSKSENVRHNYASGLRRPHSKKRPVVGIKGEEKVYFESLLAAQKSGLFTMAAIQRCLAGKASHHKGFAWSYAEERKN
jgi:hypothetical protein